MFQLYATGLLPAYVGSLLPSSILHIVNSLYLHRIDNNTVIVNAHLRSYQNINQRNRFIAPSNNLRTPAYETYWRRSRQSSLRIDCSSLRRLDRDDKLARQTQARYDPGRSFPPRSSGYLMSEGRSTQPPAPREADAYHDQQRDFV